MGAPHSLPVHEQNGGTCYAHACATILRASAVLERRPIECHKKLVEQITSRFGMNGGHCTQVLSHFCPGYKLHCEEVPLRSVDQVWDSKRVVCTSFFLSTNQWHRFCRYFVQNPSGKL